MPEKLIRRDDHIEPLYIQSRHLGVNFILILSPSDIDSTQVVDRQFTWVKHLCLFTGSPACWCRPRSVCDCTVATGDGSRKKTLEIHPRATSLARWVNVIGCGKP